MEEIKAINKQTFGQKMKSYRHRPFSLFLLIIVLLAAITTVAVLGFLVGYILVNGVPYLKPSLFEWKYTTDNVSMMPAIMNTLFMVVVSLVVSVPLGVFAAIYLAEYARRGNKFVKIIRVTAETLSGIPSIVYGLFGMLFFVNFLGIGKSILAGALTLAIMVLPTVMRTTEEALLAVPDSFREGSYGLGAGKLRTVFKIVLPPAVPGILSGVILSVGRMVGETAALLYTSTSATKMATSLMDPGRTLAVHMYVLSGEALYVNEANATAVVLLVMVIIINALSSWVAKKVGVKTVD